MISQILGGGFREAKTLYSQESDVDCYTRFYIAILHLILDSTYMIQDNKDLYAEEAAAQRERERRRMLSIPGLIAPNEIQDEMVDT